MHFYICLLLCWVVVVRVRSFSNVLDGHDTNWLLLFSSMIFWNHRHKWFPKWCCSLCFWWTFLVSWVGKIIKIESDGYTNSRPMPGSRRPVVSWASKRHVPGAGAPAGTGAWAGSRANRDLISCWWLPLAIWVWRGGPDKAGTQDDLEGCWLESSS